MTLTHEDADFRDEFMELLYERIMSSRPIDKIQFFFYRFWHCKVKNIFLIHFQQMRELVFFIIGLDIDKPVINALMA